MSKQRTVIIGAGQAGGTVAANLRQLGYDGEITVIGAEDWPPYERPPLSKTLLQGKIETERTYIRPPAFYAEQDIELITGRQVLEVNRSQRLLQLDDGDRRGYESLVIATGARARRLNIPGADHPRVHVLRDIGHALALRSALAKSERLLIVGGGFIGLEIAASARALGLSVDLIEQAPTLMGRVLPPHVASHLAGIHAGRGVMLHTGVALHSFEHRPDGGLIAQTSIGPIEADVVAVGIGSIPNTELAATAGLSIDDGVLVDEFGRTEDERIWAAGDVTRHFNPLLGRYIRLESWKNAQNQAIAVAKSIAGQPSAYAELPWLWSDQYDLNFQLAGMPRGGEELVWRGTPDDTCFTVFGLTGDTPSFAITVNQGREMRFAQQLIVRGAPVDVTRLADVSIPLQRMVA
ncbi:NAD(P)/FAD-dependent oxidoreductase [Pandoraea nosoerga]|uniref:NAD(P)/FAD-dependent oxidoreductase n=1 Tax=Pandoraea nosoerga TaxID=2508296 RepID=UPI0015816E18|nr:FAD-dependent oxidoreductase [Pandoraea nosoerga]